MLSPLSCKHSCSSLIFDVADVFTAVSSGSASYGVVPIENSSFGPVAETTEQLRTTELSVRGMLALRIGHALMASRKAEKGKLKRVFSHEQVRGACCLRFCRRLHVRLGAYRIRVFLGHRTMSTISRRAVSKRRDHPGQLDGASSGTSGGRPRSAGDLFAQVRRGVRPRRGGHRHSGCGRRCVRLSLDSLERLLTLSPLQPTQLALSSSRVPPCLYPHDILSVGLKRSTRRLSSRQTLRAAMLFIRRPVSQEARVTTQLAQAAGPLKELSALRRAPDLPLLTGWRSCSSARCWRREAEQTNSLGSQKIRVHSVVKSGKRLNVHA